MARGLTHYAQPTTPNSFNAAAGNGYWGAAADFFVAALHGQGHRRRGVERGL